MKEKERRKRKKKKKKQLVQILGKVLANSGSGGGGEFREGLIQWKNTRRRKQAGRQKSSCGAVGGLGGRGRGSLVGGVGRGRVRWPSLYFRDSCLNYAANNLVFFFIYFETPHSCGHISVSISPAFATDPPPLIKSLES